MEDREEVYYFDDNDNLVDKENSTKVIGRNLDKDGNLIKETFFVKINREKLKNFYDNMVLTEEELEICQKAREEYQKSLKK